MKPVSKEVGFLKSLDKQNKLSLSNHKLAVRSYIRSKICSSYQSNVKGPVKILFFFFFMGGGVDYTYHKL